MRLPIIPIAVAGSLVLAVLYFFSSIEPILTFDVPQLSEIADIEGVETEVAIAPDGNRYVVVSSGDLWLHNISDNSSRRMLQTPEPEAFPSWSPDGKQVTFTRGPDTLILDTDTVSAEPRLFKQNATSLSFAYSGRMAFVRDRGLWLADAGGGNEMQIVPADPDLDFTVRNPRFSPDATQVAFIKSLLDMRGEVWMIDVETFMPRALVEDRDFENPMDVGWVRGGKHLVYLTNRSGSFSVWQIDFAESQNLPLTHPLVLMPLGRIGMGVWNDRIVLPRHLVDSNIVLSDGTLVVGSESIEFEPSVSPDGRFVAYTIARENNFEIWTATIEGRDPAFRTLGREARFSANGFQLIYTHTDLAGNQDIWKHDIRTGDAEKLTDADEIDLSADASPDGRSIAFASARGGPVSIWTIPMAGGKRLRLNNGGYFPRYSPDARTIAYWSGGNLWTMSTNGSAAMEDMAAEPQPGVWTSKGLAAVFDQEIRTRLETLFRSDRQLWPQFDVMNDGRFAVAPIHIQETALWAVDITYREQ
jgi:Tol biopolymer transport system component